MSTTSTRLLQRQVLPVDRDLDVLPLYVDPEPAVLDADKYEVGSNRAARELNVATMRQGVTTGAAAAPRPDRLAHRAERPLGRPALLRHLLQRLPGQLLAPLEHRRPRSG